MRSIQILALIMIFYPEVAEAQGADRCGEAPPLQNTEIQGEIDGEISGLARFLGSAALSGEASIKFEEVISKYPSADKLLSRFYYQYQMCILIFSDTTLSTNEKINQLQEVNDKLMNIKDNSEQSSIKIDQFNKYCHNMPAGFRSDDEKLFELKCSTYECIFKQSINSKTDGIISENSWKFKITDIGKVNYIKSECDINYDSYCQKQYEIDQHARESKRLREEYLRIRERYGKESSLAIRFRSSLSSKTIIGPSGEPYNSKFQASCKFNQECMKDSSNKNVRRINISMINNDCSLELKNIFDLLKDR